MKREIRGERRQQTGEQEEKDSSGQEKVAPKIMPTSEYEAKPLLGSLAAINGVHILKVVGKICGVVSVCMCVCVCVRAHEHVLCIPSAYACCMPTSTWHIKHRGLGLT